MDKLNAPILVDSLDKPNAPNPTTSAPKPATKRGLDTTVLLVILALIVFAPLLLYVLIWLHQISYTAGAIIALWAINIAVIGVVIGASIAFVWWLFLLAQRSGIWSLDKGVPLSVFWAQRNAAIDYQKATQAYFAVLEQRAKQSVYQGVQTLTLDQSVQSDTSTTTVATADETPDTDPMPEINRTKPLFEDLKEKGLINRSNNSFMIGMELPYE